MTRYLIIGNGVAGTSAAEAIRKIDREGTITICSSESVPFYYRIRLPEIISGEKQESDLVAKKQEWYTENNITLKLETIVSGISPSENSISLADGTHLNYDTLLIATGSKSFVPPISGADIDGVYTLRTVEDALAIAKHAKKANNAVLIGGGLLGLEAGYGLIQRGLTPTVIEFFPRLLPRQLDSEAASILQRKLEAMGYRFRLGTGTEAIHAGKHNNGSQKPESVQIASGEHIPADMILISAGVRPDIALAQHAGLQCDQGIVANNRLQTSIHNIYAAGDCAQHEGKLYGIWTAAMQQGKTAGANMAGDDTAYSGTVMANTLKVVGVDVASAGNIDAENERYAIIQKDEGEYRKVVMDADRVIGCVMVGNTKGFHAVTKLMKKDHVTPEDVNALL